MLDLIVQQTRRFAEHELDATAIEREGSIPPPLRARAAALGLFGLTIPPAYGGLGLSLGEACPVVAELARFDRSVATMVGLHNGLGVRTLVDAGSDELRRRYLPQLAAGERIASFCATEPGAGSDLTALSTTGTVVGDALEVHGEKAYVTNGGIAGLFTVLVRTPAFGGVRGTSLVCIPRETPGVSVEREEHKLGLRGSSTVTVRFEGARVPLDHVLGDPGAGRELAHRALEHGRTLMSAGCVGTARAALDAARAYVGMRRQFGRPIGRFAATRAHLAWMASRLWAMEALLEHVADLEARRRPISVPSAVAKVMCSEGAFEVCDRALQLHGALGYVEDTGVARMLRDCRVTRIFEGANDVLLVHVGTALLAGAEDPARRLHDPDGLPPLLGEPARRWEVLEQRLQTQTRAIRSDKGVAAVRHQLILQRLARAHACLLATSASLARAGHPATPRDEALASSAASHLTVEAARHLDALEHAEEDEERDRRVAAFLDIDEVAPPVRRAATATRETAG